MPRTFVIALALAASAMTAEVQAQFKNTPFDSKTWNPGKWIPKDQGGYTDSWAIETGTPANQIFTFTNRTRLNVAFQISGDSRWHQLASGKRFEARRGGSGHSIRISQVNGTELAFTLPKTARYAFVVQNGKIINSYE